MAKSNEFIKISELDEKDKKIMSQAWSNMFESMENKIKISEKDYDIGEWYLIEGDDSWERYKQKIRGSSRFATPPKDKDRPKYPFLADFITKTTGIGNDVMTCNYIVTLDEAKEFVRRFEK